MATPNVSHTKCMSSMSVIASISLPDRILISSGDGDTVCGLVRTAVGVATKGSDNQALPEVRLHLRYPACCTDLLEE